MTAWRASASRRGRKVACRSRNRIYSLLPMIDTLVALDYVIVSAAPPRSQLRRDIGRSFLCLV